MLHYGILTNRKRNESKPKKQKQAPVFDSFPLTEKNALITTNYYLNLLNSLNQQV